MSSERTRPLPGQFYRIAYRWFSWTVTGLTVVLFLLLVGSALLSGPAAETADTSMLWTAYQVARGLAFSLALYFVMPFVPVLIVFWALSDGSSPDDEGSLASSLSARLVLLVMFAALTRLQGSVSIFEAVSAIQLSQVAVVLVGLCIALVGIPLAVSRFLDGRDDSEETGCSEFSNSENRTVADTEAR